MAAVRKWLLAGLLVLVPLGITVWVLEWIIATLDQTLLILPRLVASRQTHRLSHPRLRCVAGAFYGLVDWCHCQQFSG